MEKRASTQGEANKTCPNCGSGFVCEGDQDCWCERVQIHKAQMLAILEQFNDCICPACLKIYEARE
jgi:hypothetical protein